RRTIQAHTLLARNVGQLLDAACTDAPRGKVHHAQPGRVVVRIVEQPQVGKRMLDFLALEESQPAIHAVGNARREQGVLDDAGLRVAAIQNGDLAAAAPLVEQCLDLVEHHWASSRSDGCSVMRMGSPCPWFVQRFLPRRLVLCAMSALAASRMCPYER